jgi:hypothetical protein
VEGVARAGLGHVELALRGHDLGGLVIPESAVVIESTPEAEVRAFQARLGALGVSVSGCNVGGADLRTAEGLERTAGRVRFENMEPGQPRPGHDLPSVEALEDVHRRPRAGKKGPEGLDTKVPGPYLSDAYHILWGMLFFSNKPRGIATHLVDTDANGVAEFEFNRIGQGKAFVGFARFSLG